MAKFRTEVDGAKFEIESSSVSGRETVTYDGEVVSDKKSYLYMTVHSFNVQMGDRLDVFEVNVIAGVGRQGYVIRKNGIVVAHEP